MALFSFLVAVLCIPGIGSGAVVPRWTLIALVIPWLLPRQIRLTPGHVLILAFIGYCALSLFWAVDLYGGALWLFRYLLLAGLFFIGATLSSLRPVLIGSALGLAISGIVAIAQTFGFALFEQFARPAGWMYAAGLYFNPNFMAEAAVLVVVGLLTISGGIPYLISVVPAVVIPNARGAYVALIASVALMARNRMWLALGAIALAALWLLTLRYEIRISSISERFAIWRDTIDGLTWFGHGVGSFYLQYPLTATRTDTLLTRPDHAHNDYLELVFTLGPGALFIFALGFFGWRYGRDRTAAFVLLAFCVEAVFAFPLHNPVTGFIAALAAGRLFGSGIDCRDYIAGCRDWFRLRHAKRALRYAAKHRAAMAV